MKKQELKETAKKDVKELEARVLKLREELHKTVVSITSGKEKNVKKPGTLRREIAQILGIIQQKKGAASAKATASQA